MPTAHSTQPALYSPTVFHQAKGTAINTTSDK